ncbi:DivIVA domain-containing protein [Micromonospora craterilacus]|uniref:DivIVA domain-containing protein n=1 Tax=Micromonospora craterilacus TaxID=1655439 RepID=A0A2W2E2N5_9ACTN|nr:DivIVA domain-containing protein [Micromonospora craterilacus]PZG10929.1 DivIVA domain-containing protein [Micromonospora craterilacus]
MTTHSVGVFRAASRLARLCPGQVKRIRFRRTRFGRRGLAEEQVYAFLRAVVDELTAREGVEAGLRAENARLKGALREWQSNFAPRPGQMADAGRWTEPEQRR